MTYFSQKDEICNGLLPTQAYDLKSIYLSNVSCVFFLPSDCNNIIIIWVTVYKHLYKDNIKL